MANLRVGVAGAQVRQQRAQETIHLADEVHGVRVHPATGGLSRDDGGGQLPLDGGDRI